MPAWVQIILIGVSLAREILKYFNEQEISKREKREKVINFKESLKTARMLGDTRYVEGLFDNLRIRDNNGVSND